MIDKIILLDSNPYKKKDNPDEKKDKLYKKKCNSYKKKHNLHKENNEEWYEKLKKNGENLFTIQKPLLEGLDIIRGSISLYDQENAYTTKSAFDEIEEFHKIIQSKYELFTKIQDKYYGKIRGRAKKNKDLFKCLVEEIGNLKETMNQAIYNPEQHARYDIFYEVATMKAKEVAAQNSGKKYLKLEEVATQNAINYLKAQEVATDADISLAVTPLLRAYHNLETEVQTPDKDIHLIINKSIKHFLNTDILPIYNFAAFEEKIKVYNTSKKKLEETLF